MSFSANDEDFLERCHKKEKEILEYYRLSDFTNGCGRCAKEVVEKYMNVDGVEEQEKEFNLFVANVMLTSWQIFGESREHFNRYGVNVLRDFDEKVEDFRLCLEDLLKDGHERLVEQFKTGFDLIAMYKRDNGGAR